jgi:hypothetical protein
MDKVYDFFKDIKERLSNPLLSSFIIAWMIVNWKIIIGLLFYSNQELILDGYSSYIDFVSKNLTSFNAFWQPLLAALLYTFAFPFLRNCILAFNSWIKAWGNSWNLSLSRTSKISVDKYVQLREVYQARTSLLEQVLDKESTHLKEYEEEKNKVLNLTNQKNEIFSELQKWRSINDVSQLNGEWEVHYSPGPEPSIYRVRINHGMIEYLDNPPPEKNAQTSIRFFFRNPNSTFLTFVTAFDYEDRNRSYHLFQLDILDDMRVLRGVEDDKLQVEFRKSR